MMKCLTTIGNWFHKLPATSPNKTEDIDQALQELRDLNKKQTEVLQRVKQPDILRSLVISMNSGRNA